MALGATADTPPVPEPAPEPDDTFPPPRPLSRREARRLTVASVLLGPVLAACFLVAGFPVVAILFLVFFALALPSILWYRVRGGDHLSRTPRLRARLHAALDAWQLIGFVMGGEYRARMDDLAQRRRARHKRWPWPFRRRGQPPEDARTDQGAHT